MGFIGETKELVFGKLDMVKSKVEEKVDFAEIKVQITASYAKAVATAEQVPDYLKDSYKAAITRIEELHIYDNAVYASSAVVDPTTYKKLFDSALQAIDAFKTALVTFTKQSYSTAVTTAASAKKTITEKSVAALAYTQSTSVSAAVWFDSKVHVIDLVNWSLEKTAKVDDLVLGGRGQMVAVPVQGYALNKACAVDDYLLGSTGQKVVKDVTVDFAKKKAMQFVQAK